MPYSRGTMKSSFIPHADVIGVRFGLLSDSDIENMSVVEITTATGMVNKRPSLNGPRSQFLGSESSKYDCLTCMQSSRDCTVGHWGYIRGYAHFNPHKSILNITKKVLTLLCHNKACYRFVLSDEKISDEARNLSKKESKDLLTHLYKRVRMSPGTCYYCRTPVRIVEENLHFTPILKYSIGGIYKNLYPYEVYDLLNKTSRDDFLRFFPSLPPPDTLCNKNVLVSGMPLRVDMISAVNNKPETNALTSAYQMLLSYCSACESSEFPPSAELSESIIFNMDAYLLLLKYLVIGKPPLLSQEMAQRNKNFSSILTFLKQKFNNTGLSNISGKNQIVRSQQLSKRINNIAHGVATCDNEISYGEIKLPISMMKTLFIAERIADYNHERLLIHYVNGKNFPGANYIVRQIDGSRLRVEDVKSTYVPQIGDIIERHLAPGDYVIVIRQPTLNLSNITSYKISTKIDPEIMAFGINSEEYAQMKGGDFDGDESPIIASQTINGVAEMMYMLPTDKFLVNIKNTNVVLGLANNCALGIALLSLDEDVPICVLFTLLNGLNTYDRNKYCQLFDSEKITGRNIISLFLPRGLYFRAPSGWYSDLLAPYMNYGKNDKEVIVRDGVLVSGVLDSSIIGASIENSLFRGMIESLGSIKTLRIMSDLKLLSMRYLQRRGFTLNVFDAVITKEARDAIDKQIQIIEEDVIMREYKKFDANLIPADYGETSFTTMRRVLRDKTLVMDQFLPTIINGITSWKDNCILQQALAVKGGTAALLKLGSPIGPVILKGDLIAPTVFGRPSRHTKRNARDLATLPYANSNYVRGLSALDSILLAPAQRMSLVQRINGTAQSGTDRSERLNAQSMFYLDYHGHICHGDLLTGVHFASMSYGADGLMVNELAVTKVGKIIMTSSMEQLKANYFLPEKMPASAREYGTRLWELFAPAIESTRRAMVNSSMSGIIEYKYFLKMYVPYSIELHVDLDSDPDWSVVPKNIKHVEGFAGRLLSVHENALATTSNKKIIYSKMRLVMLYSYFCFSVGVLARIPAHRIVDIADNFYMRYLNAIAPPGFSAGTLAGITQSETMVQNSLDAPKKQADTKIAKEEALHAKIYNPRHVLRHNHTYLAPLKPEYRTNIEHHINNIIDIRFSKFIKDIVVVASAINDKKLINMFNIKMNANDHLIPLYLYINLKRVQFQKFGTTLGEIIDKIEEYHDAILAVESKTAGEITTIVIAFTEAEFSNLCQNLNYSDVKYSNINTFIKMLTDEIIVRGSPNIRSAKLVQAMTLQETADGTIKEVLVPYLTILSDDYYGVMRLEIIDHKFLFCENPNVMVEIYGLNAARMGAILASMRILKTHYNHVATSVDILFMKGRAITFGSSGQDKRIDKSALISAVSVDPKGKYITAAARTAEMPVSDVMSAQLMGQKAHIGTGMCDILPLPFTSKSKI